MTYVFILFTPEGTRDKPISGSIHWYTFILPFLIPLIPIITLVVDVCTRQFLASAKEIERVDTKVSFWLSVLALVTALIWLGIVQWIRRLSLKPVKRQERAEEQVKSRWDISSLWPWK